MKLFSCIDAAMMYTEHTNRKSFTDHGGFTPQFKQPILLGCNNCRQVVDLTLILSVVLALI